MIYLLISVGLIALVSVLLWLLSIPANKVAEDSANGKVYFDWPAVDRFMPMHGVNEKGQRWNRHTGEYEDA